MGPGLRQAAGGAEAIPGPGLSPDRKTATAVDDKVIQLCEAATGKVQSTLSGHGDRVTSVAFSLDGRLLVSGSEDKTVKVWDLSTGKERTNLPGHKLGVEFVTISPDGKFVASGDGKETKIWEVSAGKPMEEYEIRARCGAFSPDGKLVAFGSDNGETDLYDLAKKEITTTLHGHGKAVRAVAFSPDGQWLATGATFPQELTNDFKTLPKDPSEPVLRLWQVKTGKPAAILYGHQEDVRALAFTPDSTTLVSGSGDGTVRVWEVSGVKSGKE